MNDEHIPQYRELLLGLVPPSGQTIGNKALRTAWIQRSRDAGLPEPSEDDYWRVRNLLISEGKIMRGTGMGGSVHLLESKTTPVAEIQLSDDYPDEVSLYEPFQKTISDSYTKDYGIEEFVCDITAFQGKRNTGGKWTRPDVTLIAVRMYPFIPGKTLEVVTFEIKPLGGYDVDGVFETAAHSAFANRSYLAIHSPTSPSDTEAWDRILSECERFGVGLILFADPKEWDSFDIRIEAKSKTPDPADTSLFIKRQMQPVHQNKLERMVR